MLIRVFSDVHNEFLRTSKGLRQDLWVPEPTELDSQAVLILAGDIDNAKNIPEYLNSLAPRFKAVIHVAGNHEYYGTDIVKANAKMKEGLLPNVHHLNNDHVTIEGQRFVGATMWTNTTKNPLVQYLMNDYKKIRIGGGNYGRLSHLDTSAMFAETLQYFHNTVKSDDIVITHHQPLSPPSAGPYGKTLQDTDYAYYACLDTEVASWNPKAWIAGHIHDSTHFKHYGTTVITNCVGYPGDGDTHKKDSFYEI